MRLRVLTWNINGLRRVVAAFGSLQRLLDALAPADVICFQETKLTRGDLRRELALADGWESFFAFTRGKVGYSGVATFCRRDRALPQHAEEGFSGALLDCTAGNRTGGPTAALHPRWLADGWSAEELRNLDGEGRVVITDHGAFVLVNVYGPAITSEERAEERMSYKMRFYQALQVRLDSFLGEGRRVILLGDLNIAPAVIDVCGATPRDFNTQRADRAWLRGLMTRGRGQGQGLQGPGQEHGQGHEQQGQMRGAPAMDRHCTKDASIIMRSSAERSEGDSEGDAGSGGDEDEDEDEELVVLDSRLEGARRPGCGAVSGGGDCGAAVQLPPFVDTFRAFHPRRQHAYTCWNTSSGARVNNYGSRIDHVLVADGSCYHKRRSGGGSSGGSGGSSGGSGGSGSGGGGGSGGVQAGGAGAGQVYLPATAGSIAADGLAGSMAAATAAAAGGAADSGAAAGHGPCCPDWLVAADIMPDMEGSDHAPAWVELELPDDQLMTRGSLATSAGVPPLPLSTRSWFDASRQATLHSVLARRPQQAAATPAAPPTEPSQPPPGADASTAAGVVDMHMLGALTCSASAGIGNVRLRAATIVTAAGAAAVATATAPPPRIGSSLHRSASCSAAVPRKGTGGKNAGSGSGGGGSSSSGRVGSGGVSQKKLTCFLRPKGPAAPPSAQSSGAASSVLQPCADRHRLPPTRGTYGEVGACGRQAQAQIQDQAQAREEGQQQEPRDASTVGLASAPALLQHTRYTLPYSPSLGPLLDTSLNGNGSGGGSALPESPHSGRWCYAGSNGGGGDSNIEELGSGQAADSPPPPPPYPPPPPPHHHHHHHCEGRELLGDQQSLRAAQQPHEKLQGCVREASYWRQQQQELQQEQRLHAHEDSGVALLMGGINPKRGGNCGMPSGATPPGSTSGIHNTVSSAEEALRRHGSDSFNAWLAAAGVGASDGGDRPSERTDHLKGSVVVVGERVRAHPPAQQAEVRQHQQQQAKVQSEERMDAPVAAGVDASSAAGHAPSGAGCSLAAAHAWRQIQDQMKPPRCSGHGEPCVVRTVKKRGENNGRQFWCCARPDGLPPNGRCDFFQWARGRTTAAAAAAAGRMGASSGHGGVGAPDKSGGAAAVTVTTAAALGYGGAGRAPLSNMPRKKPRK